MLAPRSPQQLYRRISRTFISGAKKEEKAADAIAAQAALLAKCAIFIYVFLFSFLCFLFLFKLRKKEDSVRDAIAAQAALWGGCVAYLFIFYVYFFIIAEEGR